MPQTVHRQSFKDSMAQGPTLHTTYSTQVTRESLKEPGLWRPYRLQRLCTSVHRLPRHHRRRKTPGPETLITWLNYNSLVLTAHWPELVTWLVATARSREDIIFLCVWKKKWDMGELKKWQICMFLKNKDFHGISLGSVVKNPPADAGDTGSIPGPGRCHVPHSN